MTEYGDWSDCSVTCGNGTETRSRKIEVYPVGQGDECPDLIESRPCSKDLCPGGDIADQGSLDVVSFVTKLSKLSKTEVLKEN